MNPELLEILKELPVNLTIIILLIYLIRSQNNKKRGG